MQKIYQFIKNNGLLLALALIFSYLCFAYKLAQPTLSIDEEFWIFASTSDNLIWLLQNRFSLYLYNLIFTNNGTFTPIWPDIFGVLFWVISGFIFLDFFWELTNENRFFVKATTLCLYSSLPLCMAEAFGFSMMIIPETLAMIMVAIAFRIFNQNGLKSYLLPSLLLVAALGVYQALLGLFLTAIFGLCFFKGCNEKKTLVKGIGISFAAFLLYIIINKIIALNVGDNSYLSQNYIGWLDERGVIYAAFMAFANVIRVSFGITIQNVCVYGGLGISLMSILFISTAIFRFAKQRNFKQLLFGVALFISPFMMYIGLGTYKTPGRTLLALALLLALEMLYIFQNLQRKKIRIAFAILTVLFLAANAYWINNIYHHQHLLNIEDEVTVKTIDGFLKENSFNYEKPVIFIGNLNSEKMDFKKSGTLGCSFFSYDDGNNARMRAIFKLWGNALKEPTSAQIQDAYEISASLEDWPNAESFKEMEPFAIIRFSEPTEKWKRVNLH